MFIVFWNIHLTDRWDPNKYNQSRPGSNGNEGVTPHSIGVLQKTNVIYQFKCPLGDCISDNDNIYVGLTSTTLSRRLTMHLSNTSSIVQHLKKHSCPTIELRKILTDNTTILEHQNNKRKLQILEALHIRNMQPTLYRINFQTSANVLKMSLATGTIYRNPFKSKCYTLQRSRRSYIVIICKNKSYVTFVIDPPLIMAQSRAESIRDIYNYGQYRNQFLSNTIKEIRQYEWIQKKICKQKMSILFNEIYIYIYI